MDEDNGRLSREDSSGSDRMDSYSSKVEERKFYQNYKRWYDDSTGELILELREIEVLLRHFPPSESVSGRDEAEIRVFCQIHKLTENWYFRGWGMPVKFYRNTPSGINLINTVGMDNVSVLCPKYEQPYSSRRSFDYNAWWGLITSAWLEPGGFHWDPCRTDV